MQALLLAATAAGAVSAGTVQAQETTGLRGALTAADTNSGLLAGEDARPAEAAPAYVPVSPGALPEEDAPRPPRIFAADPALPGEAEAQPQSPVAAAASRAAAAAEIDQTPTGTVRQPTVDSLESESLDRGAQRAQAIEGLDRPIEENPYEAPGITFGTFILKPSIEQGVTATSNADSSTDGSEAVLSETTLRLNAVSDWSRHSATVDAFGTFRKTLSGQEVDDFEGGVDAVLDLELAHEYRARGTFTYSAAPESAASPVVIANTVEEPITQRVGGTLGLQKDMGKARFGITGGAIHDSYGDADLEGGGTLSQSDRDATLYTMTLRAGYEISPALTPFVETEIGRNQYDQEVDSAGYQRSSDRYAVRGGLELDLGEKFSGEVAAGWVREDFDDDRLDALSTPTVDGLLRWSPERGTDVTLSGSTILEGTTTAGESGSVLYSSRIGIERQIRSNLTGGALLGVAYRNYSQSDGYDVIFDAEASLTWWLNRYAGVVTRVEHETVTSNLSDRDAKTNSIFLGLKLQR
ncbi:outer membrane beta-barrel protein [Mesorhizobium sp. YM1C-6-2]|uniref:outer membrane beta-barrel protein n=1 Tax=Mesorhizobium sp. YM1C-6-2 TaxID=1827501 RepID=UPI001FE1EC8D|nr:outer membrane beta-barrel protein [Mesorhizobium sp. YM1C-6-2]